MVAFLSQAGFQNAKEHRVRHMLAFRDEDDYLTSILKATPIGHSLSEEPVQVQQEVLAKTRSNLRSWRTAEGLSIPAECVVVTARK